MTVKQLKEQFESYIEILDEFYDELEIPMRPNTYGICGDFMYSDGFRDRGYIELDSLAENLSQAEYEFDGDED